MFENHDRRYYTIYIYAYGAEGALCLIYKYDEAIRDDTSARANGGGVTISGLIRELLRPFRAYVFPRTTFIARITYVRNERERRYRIIVTVARRYLTGNAEDEIFNFPSA